jgi:hypothetical protein
MPLSWRCFNDYETCLGPNECYRKRLVDGRLSRRFQHSSKLLKTSQSWLETISSSVNQLLKTGFGIPTSAIGTPPR